MCCAAQATWILSPRSAIFCAAGARGQRARRIESHGRDAERLRGARPLIRGHEWNRSIRKARPWCRNSSLRPAATIVATPGWPCSAWAVSSPCTWACWCGSAGLPTGWSPACCRVPAASKRSGFGWWPPARRFWRCSWPRRWCSTSAPNATPARWNSPPPSSRRCSPSCTGWPTMPGHRARTRSICLRRSTPGCSTTCR